MVPAGLGVSSAKELDGATVCIQTGTTTELNLADFFRSNNISYEPVPIETNAEAQQQYLAGACDVYTTDVPASRPPARRSKPRRSRDSARNRLERAAWPARASRRQRLGRRRALDAERADRGRRAGRDLGQHRRVARAPTTPKSTVCSAPRATWARCWASTPTGPSAHHGGRQLRRDLREEHRREHPDRSGARPERAVDRWRPALLAAVPLRPKQKGRAANRALSTFRDLRKNKSVPAARPGPRTDDKASTGTFHDDTITDPPKASFRLSMLITTPGIDPTRSRPLRLILLIVFRLAWLEPYAEPARCRAEHFLRIPGRARRAMTSTSA
jgi:hypothetical protein